MYAYAVFRPVIPTPATRPRPPAPTYPEMPSESAHEVVRVPGKSDEEGAPPSVKAMTYGPWRPKRWSSVWFWP